MSSIDEVMMVSLQQLVKQIEACDGLMASSSIALVVHADIS